jgi:hypothetical protein
MTTITYQPVTQRELGAMLTYACDLVRAYPRAGDQAVAEKLLTVWPGTEQGLRGQVATTARLLIDRVQLAA